MPGEVADRTAERDRIWDASQILLGVADADGIWQSVNPAWPRMLGWPAEEIIGKRSAWMLHPDDVERLRALVAWIAQGEAISGFENWFSNLYAQHRTPFAAAPFSRKAVIYATARDVTDERRRQ